MALFVLRHVANVHSDQRLSLLPIAHFGGGHRAKCQGELERLLLHDLPDSVNCGRELRNRLDHL